MPLPPHVHPPMEALVPLHDLHCEHGHVQRDHFVKRAPDDNDFGPCPEPGCAAPMRQYWGETHAVRKADLFTPITIEGRHYGTRDEWNAHIAGIQRLNPGREVVVNGETRAGWRAEGENLKHDYYRRIGVRNDREHKELIREAKNQRPARR